MTKRILIVDDERHIGTLLTHALDVLEHYDVELIVVEAVEDAMLSIAQGSPNLAFIDVAMPDSGGWKVCQALRKAEPVCNIQIVMLEDKGLVTDPARCAEFGVYQCVPKPFDPDAICELACVALEIELDA